MSKHKKSHNHSHQRREQFTQAAPSRRAVSPTMVVLALSALFGVVLVYVIVTGGRASSQVAITAACEVCSTHEEIRDIDGRLRLVEEDALRFLPAVFHLFVTTPGRRTWPPVSERA